MSERDRSADIEYGELLTSMLLCNHFNPESDKALRKCVTIARRSMVTPQIRQLAYAIIKAKTLTPCKWLGDVISDLQEYCEIVPFLEYVRTGNALELS